MFVGCRVWAWFGVIWAGIGDGGVGFIFWLMFAGLGGKVFVSGFSWAVGCIGGILI